ncbi:MAG: phytoene desaturase family protein [Methermicoccaceae archaeon]
MKVVVVGAGLGGLLSAAFLSQKGFEVDVYERLPRVGGRFSNLPYRGYTLSTGALHMVPHGKSGPLGDMLFRLGVRPEFVGADPPALIATGEHTFDFEDFYKYLGRWERLKVAWLFTASKVKHPGGSFEGWFYPKIPSDFLLQIADSFCGWAFSLTSDEVPAAHVIKVLHNIRKYGMPEVIVGGCGRITDSLVELIEAEGGKVHTNAVVERITTEEGRVKEVIVDGASKHADIVISNIGHVLTADMLDHPPAEYLSLTQSIKPSRGIKLCVSTKASVFNTPAVVFTPFTHRVSGMVELTSADPSLAPPGRTLIMSHQPVRGNNL